jgi:SAM-dependent methyltransferase
VTEAVTCVACGTAFPPAPAVAFRKDGFDIVRCPSCGLLFRAQLPTPAELNAIYGSEYFFSNEGETHGQGYSDYLAEADLHRESARRRLARLERYAQRGSLLDVGAAAGFFVDEASRRGWDARGVDISDAMAAWGRERLHARIDTGALTALELPSASLDVVTMWDYIEHSIDPYGELARSAELLRPGGLLALSTGDSASIAARLLGSRWHLLTPRHHNFFYSPPTLRRLLDRTGFDVVESGHPGARYSLAYLSHKLRTLADVAPLRLSSNAFAHSRAGRITIPLNLFDIVTVYARRR